MLNHVPLNTDDIKQEFLNIDNKERSNPLPWNGQFSPQLIEVLLNTYSQSRSTVLDPFAGSGTILQESAIVGLSAIASDINPAACYLARVYTIANRKLPERKHLVARLDEILPDLFDSDLPLFAPCHATHGKHDHARKIAKIIEEESEVTSLLETLLVLADFAKPRGDDKQIIHTWKRLRLLILNLPYCSQPLRVFNSDARQVPVDAKSIGLVVTSPPYVNVFNYHQNYRASTEAFGWDLLTIAKSEIGSNRKNRGNRFLTVTQYCLDLAQSFAELTRVCEDGCRIIFVVGRESQVLGVPFYNGKIISSLATRTVGCKLVTRQERVFKNRFGQNIYEDILHFIPPVKAVVPSLDEAREIALDALQEGLRVAKSDVALDLRDAIERIPSVKPSIVYDPQVAKKQSKSAVEA